MRTLYIECNMGAAGDMLMAALYELLDDKAAFIETMNSLGLAEIKAEPSIKKGICGTHMRVIINGAEEITTDAEPGADTQPGGAHAHSKHSHASLADIAGLVESLNLSLTVKSNNFILCVFKK